MGTKFGGCFAPPLDDVKLASYAVTVDGLPESPVKDALKKVLACCQEWWKQPDSVGDGKPHPSGRGVIVDLDESIAKTLWESIPWREELDLYATLFETIDNVTQKPLRDTAFHLLWHAYELEQDREPITTNKL